jgi:small-conductance mechanosensitive channel
LLSAGVAVALGDLLASFVGWIFILLRRPYEVGDRVEIDGKLGDVIDIRLFNTYLMECGQWVDADQSTGRILMVPNGYVFKKSIANFTAGFDFIWDEIPVLVTFESDWRKARRILQDIADRIALPMAESAKTQIHRAAGKHMIVFKKLTPIVYTSVKDSGVMLTIRYLTPPRQRRNNATQIWEAILDAFAKEPSIDLAYPTQRAYLNFVEGKPAMRPKDEE